MMCPSPPTHCPTVRADLSRFLDNDLSSREATLLAAHLETCPSCRREHDALRNLQTAMRGLPVPPAPYGGVDAARDRVLARLERAVRVGDTAASAPPLHSANRTTRWGWPAAALSACVVFGFAVATTQPSRPTTTPTFTRTTPFSANEATEPVASVPLPAPDEMAVMFHLHDAHGGGLSAADPTDRRDTAAEARAALLRLDSDSLADVTASRDSDAAPENETGVF